MSLFVQLGYAKRLRVIVPAFNIRKTKKTIDDFTYSHQSCFNPPDF